MHNGTFIQAARSLNWYLLPTTYRPNVWPTTTKDKICDVKNKHQYCVVLKQLVAISSLFWYIEMKWNFPEQISLRHICLINILLPSTLQNNWYAIVKYEIKRIAYDFGLNWADFKACEISNMIKLGYNRSKLLTRFLVKHIHDLCPMSVLHSIQ